MGTLTENVAWGSEGLLFNAKDGFLEGIIRGCRGGLLTPQDYSNLTQCETLDDVKLHLVSLRQSQALCRHSHAEPQSCPPPPQHPLLYVDEHRRAANVTLWISLFLAVRHRLRFRDTKRAFSLASVDHCLKMHAKDRGRLQHGSLPGRGSRDAVNSFLPFSRVSPTERSSTHLRADAPTRVMLAVVYTNVLIE